MSDCRISTLYVCYAVSPVLVECASVSQTRSGSFHGVVCMYAVCIVYVQVLL